MSRAITPELVVSRAREWWDKTGRHVMRRQANEEEIGRRVRVGGNAPAIVTQGAIQPVLNSGILQCLEFDQLKRHEQFRVVKVWRQFHAPDAELQPQDEATRNRLKLQ